MVCEIGTNIIACGPPRGVYKRRESADCPECGEGHRFVIRWDGVWYGTTYFGACGDTWQEGERLPRPFEKGWRRKAVKHFEAMWESAPPVEMYERYVDADCNMAEESWQEREAAHQAIRDYRSALLEGQTDD